VKFLIPKIASQRFALPQAAMFDVNILSCGPRRELGVEIYTYKYYKHYK
jgi:hypothetical protein